MFHDDEEIRFAERLKRLKGEQYEKVFIGHAIRKLRQKTGKTQSQLAKELKTSQSVVARIEQGKQNLTVKTLVRISEIFGKKLDVNFQ